MRSFTPSAAGCALAVLMLVMLAQEAEATTFRVGDSEGWSDKASINYDQWISNYKIKVGDTIRFNNFDTTDHTVVEASKEAYETCGESGEMDAPSTISPGIYVEWTFFESGETYVICDIPSHCVKGQKMHIQVLNKDGSVNTTVSSGNHGPPGTSDAPRMPGFTWTSQLVMIVVVSTFFFMAAAASM